MNSYEIAVLRILVKRQTPIKISDLIFGFPDNSGGRVLHAISNLHSLGYVLIYGAPFDGYLLLAKDKRREAIRIISSNISNDNQARGSSYSEQIVNPSVKNKTFILLAMMGIAALSIVIISALAILWLVHRYRIRLLHIYHDMCRWISYHHHRYLYSPLAINIQDRPHYESQQVQTHLWLLVV